MDRGRGEQLGLMSIGHSIHEIAKFVSLLEENEVEVVADIRSAPYSRFNPQFNRENLRRSLLAHDIRHDFHGRELGGRPEGDELYDPDGHVLYGRVAETARFRSGLRRLIEAATASRVAMMCSEEDPSSCHRLLLVTRVLHGRGRSVTHIRGDGSTQHTEQISASGLWSDSVYEEQSLLDPSPRSTWRSPKPVPRPRRTAEWR